jgi:inositol phosphorylceramide mannosyltransferase catalytic subunit
MADPTGTIPRILHQIWIGPHAQPVVWTDTFERDYMAQNPEYEYILWTEKNIGELFADFPVSRVVYDNEPTYNGKSDILRYLILYKYGGIYVDADSVWVNHKSFDPLIEGTNSTGVFVSVHPRESDGMCGGVMGATPGNPLIKLLITEIEKYVLRGEIVAPIDYVRRTRVHGASFNVGPAHIHRHFTGKGVTVFPSVYFYPVSWHGKRDVDAHTSMEMPSESFTYQYGYSTNNMEDAIASANT